MRSGRAQAPQRQTEREALCGTVRAGSAGGDLLNERLAAGAYEFDVNPSHAKSDADKRTH